VLGRERLSEGVLLTSEPRTTRSARHVLEGAIRAADGTVGGYAVLTHVPQPLSSPFGTAQPVEHETVEAIEVGATALAPSDTGFLDGIQRYAVVGRFGLVPVVRGYVAAAVMGRHDQNLSVESQQAEEFIAVNMHRLSDRQVLGLEDTGLPLYDTGETEREHPILEVHLAAQVVEARREAAELSVAKRYLGIRREGWLVVDGSITPYLSGGDSARVLGVIKSHETQFLTGSDLATALTLPACHRTSVFARRAGERKQVHSWYLRLWPWEGHDLFFGLVRLERLPAGDSTAQATEISSWLLSERSPLSAPDGRWDRLIYPVHQVESYLRAQIGDWL